VSEQQHVRAVLAVLARDPRQGGRSRLYFWMRNHHDELRDGFVAHRPDWRLLAQEFTRLGLTDRNGVSVKPETARKTWVRVRADVARVRANRGGTVLPPLARAAIAAPSMTPSSGSKPVIRQWSEALPARSDERVEDVFSAAFSKIRPTGRLPRQVRKPDAP
jgi:hypothetical protein